MYDPSTKTGILLDDSGSDLPIASDALDGSLFITLRQGQRVNYDLVERAGVRVATRFRFGHDGY